MPEIATQGPSRDTLVGQAGTAKADRRCGRRWAALTCATASLLCVELASAAPQPLGLRGLTYIDPEFEPNGMRMVFQDGNGRAWVAQLDPETGLCVSRTCYDKKVAENLLLGSDPRYFFNGPEWGVSAQGARLYLTIYDENRIGQGWRVNPDGTELTQLTFDPDGAWGGLVSVAPNAPTVRVLSSTGVEADDVMGTWFDEDERVVYPMDNVRLNGQGGQFLPRSSRFAVYSYKSALNDTQVAILDTELNTTEVVTDTPGRKSQTWGFAWNGVLHVAVVRDLVEIEIYRSGRMTPWQKVAGLTPPVPGFLFSTELLGNSGCFATAIQDNDDRRDYTDSAIYVACVDGSWTRVDDGALMTRRSEPEAWWTGRNWRVFYNVNTGTIWVSDPFRTPQGN